MTPQSTTAHRHRIIDKCEDDCALKIDLNKHRKSRTDALNYPNACIRQKYDCEGALCDINGDDRDAVLGYDLPHKNTQ